MKRAVGTPSALELTLIEGMDNLKAPAGLRPIVAEAGDAGIQYVLVGHTIKMELMHRQQMKLQVFLIRHTIAIFMLLENHLKVK